MIVTDYVKRALAERREARRMRAAGYRLCETDWEIIRGARWREMILDVVVASDRKHVWTKIGPLNNAQ